MSSNVSQKTKKAVLSDSLLEGMVVARERLDPGLTHTEWLQMGPLTSRGLLLPHFHPEATGHSNLSYDKGPQHRNEKSSPALLLLLL